MIALDAALARLESEDKPIADLVKLHFFVGLSLEEAADASGVSRATAYRRWTYARAWLRHEVRAPPGVAITLKSVRRTVSGNANGLRGARHSNG